MTTAKDFIAAVQERAALALAKETVIRLETRIAAVEAELASLHRAVDVAKRLERIEAKLWPEERAQVRRQQNGGTSG